MRLILAPRELGVAPWDLMAQEDDDFWTEAGMLLRTITGEAYERARNQA